MSVELSLPSLSSEGFLRREEGELAALPLTAEAFAQLLRCQPTWDQLQRNASLRLCFLLF